MAEIRLAQRKDIPQLIVLGEEFALFSQPYHHFSVDRDRIIHFTNEIVEAPGCLVIVLHEGDTVVGVIAGLIQEIFFSKDIAMQELVWYVKKGYGGKLLLDAFEKFAVAMGANKVIVGNKPAYCDLGNFYIRRGYTMLENQYQKDVGGVECLS
jgi:hypothetical protein